VDAAWVTAALLPRTALLADFGEAKQLKRKQLKRMIDSLRKQGIPLTTAICRDCFGKMLKIGHVGLKNKQRRHKQDRKPQAARRAEQVSKVYRATAQPPTTKPSTLASVGAYLSGGCGWGTDEDTATANFAKGTTSMGCSTTSSAAYPELDSDSVSESGVSWADWEASYDCNKTYKEALMFNVRHEEAHVNGMASARRTMEILGENPSAIHHGTDGENDLELQAKTNVFTSPFAHPPSKRRGKSKSSTSTIAQCSEMAKGILRRHGFMTLLSINIGSIDRELQLRGYLDIDHYRRSMMPKLQDNGLLLPPTRKASYGDIRSTVFSAARRALGTQGRNMSREGGYYNSLLLAASVPTCSC
jgi:hypothetical protein